MVLPECYREFTRVLNELKENECFSIHSSLIAYSESTYRVFSCIITVTISFDKTQRD